MQTIQEEEKVPGDFTNINQKSMDDL
jgi:hypothetical protein